MLTFNLKKEWFEKIKSGEKTHEYRQMTAYWITRINNALKNDKKFNLKCCFCCGYPKKEDKEKRLFAEIIRIKRGIWGFDTDLKINAYVYDIEFKLISECEATNE